MNSLPSTILSRLKNIAAAFLPVPATSIRVRLMLGFVGVAVLVGTVGYVSFVTNKSASSATRHLRQHAIEERLAAAAMKDALVATHDGVQDLILERYRVVAEPDEAEAAHKEGARFEQSIQAQVENIRKQAALNREIVGSQTAPGESENFKEEPRSKAAALDGIEQNLKVYQAHLREYIRLVHTDLSRADEFKRETLRPFYDRNLMPLAENYEAETTKTLEKEAAAVEAALKRESRLNVFATVAALLLTLSAGILLANSVSKPARRLKAAALEIGAGDLEARVVGGGRDEFGLLANAFNEMAEQIAARASKLEIELDERRRAEAALRESEAEYRALLQASSDFVWTVDENGRAEDLQKWWQDLTGQTPEQSKDWGWFDALHEEDRQLTRRAWQEAFFIRRVFETEYRILTRDGEYRWFAMRAVPVEGSEGSKKWVGTMSDIDERRRQAETLRKSEQFENLFRLANDAIVIFEPETEIVLNVNDKACEVYGLSRKEFIGRSLKEMSKNVARGEEQFDKLLAEGAYQAFETVQFHSSGAPIDFLINSSIIEYEGKPAILSINRDITERKRMEDALRRSEEHFRSVARSAQDAIISADARGDIIFWNEGANKIFGYTEAEAIGQSLQMIMPAALRAAHQTGLQRNISARANRLIGKTVEVPGRRKNAEEFPLELTLGTWETGDGEKCFTAVVRDITDRKRAVEALRESEERFRSFMNDSPAVAFMKDEAGRQVYVNKTMERVFGVDKDFLLGKTDFEWMPEDVARQVRANDEKVLFSDQTIEVEESVPTSDGNPRDWMVYKFPFTDAGGRRFIGGVAVDITERKRAEETLRENLSLLNSTLEATADGILAVDGRGLVVTTNRKFTRMWNLPDNYFQRLEPGLPPEEVISQLKKPEDFVESVRRIQLDQTNDSFDVLELKDGRIYERHSKPQMLGGEIVGRVFSFRDITAQRQAEEERNRTFTLSLDLLCTAGFDGYFKRLNPAWASLGYAEQELFARAFLDFIHPDDRAATEKEVERLLNGGIVQDFEIRLVGKDGRIRWFVWSATPFVSERVFYAVGKDITERKQAEEKLLALASIVESSHDAIIGKRLDGVITSWNNGARRIFGYEAAETIGRHISILFPPERLDEEEKIIASIRAGKSIDNFETVRLRRDGTPIPVSLTVSPIKDASGEIVGVSKIAHDITKRKATKDALLKEKTFTETATASLPGIFYVFDEDGRYLRWNENFERVSGYAPDEIRRLHPLDLFPPADQALILQRIGEVLRNGEGAVEGNFLSKDGTLTPYFFTGKRVVLDGKACVVGMGIDITERKRAEEQLLYDAFHDGLTGLANRALFTNHLQMAIERGRRLVDALFAVLFLDFDRFKIINDSLGHAEGDKLLVQAARRLEAILRPGDLIARLGGDEFTILLGELDAPDDAVQIAERIQTEMKIAFDLGGRKVFTSASIGIAFSRAGYDRAEEILRDADIAMYRAKAQGRARHQVFDQAMHRHALSQLQLETEMRAALENDEFLLHYQPIVNLETGHAVGFESLVRWRHHEHGTVSPAEFIPLAEENGLILPLGRWILGESCRQMRAWQAANSAARDLTVSVNLSSKQFQQQDLSEQVAAVLDETGLDARCLKLEITESHVMENSETAIATLERLRALGVELSLDDFGTGYSSLSYLHRLPVTNLKIDRSFVSRMIGSEENSEIVRTIIKLAQNLKMRVVAEGIETEEQADYLKQLKCEYGQGYLFSRPLAASDAEQFLAQTRKSSRRRNPQLSTKSAACENSKAN